jgi:hypothetical protein
LSGRSTLNGSTPQRRANGRDHVAECTCPTCGSVISKTVHTAILLQSRQHDAEIEKAITARFTVQLAEAQKVKRAEIDAAVKAATTALRDGQSAAIAAALEAERKRSEKAVADAVNAAMIEFATEKARLETTLADVQRKLQARTPHDRGEPAEQSLHDALVAVLPPTDIVRRVEKGQPGVDVIVEIVHGNTVVGKIVIDSKAHARWQNSFCTKLRADQLREGAAFGILSSSVMPKGASHLHLQEGTIVCHPDRVPVLVTLLRKVIVDNHVQKRGAEARNKKAEAILTFLLSGQADDLFTRLVAATRSLATLDATEVKSHQTTWTKRAGLIRDVVDIHDSLTTTISDIVSGGRK